MPEATDKDLDELLASDPAEVTPPAERGLSPKQKELLTVLQNRDTWICGEDLGTRHPDTSSFDKKITELESGGAAPLPKEVLAQRMQTLLNRNRDIEGRLNTLSGESRRKALLAHDRIGDVLATLKKQGVTPALDPAPAPKVPEPSAEDPEAAKRKAEKEDRARQIAQKQAKIKELDNEIGDLKIRDQRAAQRGQQIQKDVDAAGKRLASTEAALQEVRKRIAALEGKSMPPEPEKQPVFTVGGIVDILDRGEVLFSKQTIGGARQKTDGSFEYQINSPVGLMWFEEHNLVATTPEPPKESEKPEAPYFVEANELSIEGDGKKPNQDATLVDVGAGLFAVIDGMGGHDGGREAAQFAKQYFERHANELAACTTANEVAQKLSTMIVECSTALQKHATAISKPDARTTLALVKLWPNPDGTRHAVVAHVGDSRVYKLDSAANNLVPLTLDDGNPRSGQTEEVAWKIQSLFSDLTIDMVPIGHFVYSGRPPLTDAQKEKYREAFTPLFGSDDPFDPTKKDVLDAMVDYWFTRNETSGLGGARTPRPTVYEVKINTGDKLLITSDGVHDNLTDTELLHQLMKKESATTISKNIVEASIFRSRERITDQWDNSKTAPHPRAKGDNTSTIVIHVKDAPKPPEPPKPEPPKTEPWDLENLSPAHTGAEDIDRIKRTVGAQLGVEPDGVVVSDDGASEMDGDGVTHWGRGFRIDGTPIRIFSADCFQAEGMLYRGSYPLTADGYQQFLTDKERDALVFEQAKKHLDAMISQVLIQLPDQTVKVVEFIPTGTLPDGALSAEQMDARLKIGDFEILVDLQQATIHTIVHGDEMNELESGPTPFTADSILALKEQQGDEQPDEVIGSEDPGSTMPPTSGDDTPPEETIGAPMDPQEAADLLAPTGADATKDNSDGSMDRVIADQLGIPVKDVQLLPHVTRPADQNEYAWELFCMVGEVSSKKRVRIRSNGLIVDEEGTVQPFTPEGFKALLKGI
ncbi:protein phosphatase 2C domain-containing protein [Candidatus Uhrbacteria bacterium]|nr:protein phosphatase 2C domain-containing protein [Candidatus Uhrbacteria bacterium]